MAEKKTVTCPNCNSPAIREGNVIICEVCDAEYVIHQQARTVKGIGRIEQLETRVAQLETKLGESKDPPAAGPKTEPKKEDAILGFQHDEEESILPG